MDASEVTEPGLFWVRLVTCPQSRRKGRPSISGLTSFLRGDCLRDGDRRRAFARRSAAETLSAILQEEPKPIAELSPKTPTQLRWIIERCLAKDPEERYASTRDLARELQASARSSLGGGKRGSSSGSWLQRLRPEQDSGELRGLIILVVTLLAVFSLISFYRGENKAKQELLLSSGPTFPAAYLSPRQYHWSEVCRRWSDDYLWSDMGREAV